MNVSSRIRAIRLSEKLEKNGDYAKKLGVRVVMTEKHPKVKENA